MPKESSNIREKTISRIKEPHKYNVLFHNDDFTPMDLVTMILKQVFFKNQIEAESLMLKVHNEGKAVVGTYTFDIAMTKATTATNIARTNGFPLKITVSMA